MSQRHSPPLGIAGVRRILAAACLVLAAFLFIAPTVLAASAAGTWTPLTAGLPPTRRFGSSGAYDPVRNRVWIFGGFDGAAARGELFSRAFNAPTAWKLETPGGLPPAPRLAASLTYDPVGDRLILFGGSDGTSSLGDLWELDLGGAFVWTPMVAAGTPPAARNQHDAVYDPVRQRVLIIDGFASTGPFNDAWSLDLSTPTPTWSQLSPLGTSPVARANPAIVYDPVGDQVVLFGGNSALPGHPLNPLNDTWTLSLAGTPTWTHITPPNPLPPIRTSHDACFDSARRRMIVAGGSALFTVLSDVWALDLNTMTWSNITPSGTGIGPRSSAPLVYDSADDLAFLTNGRDTVRPLDTEAAVTFGPTALNVFAPDARFADKFTYDASTKQAYCAFGVLADGSFTHQVRQFDLSAAVPAWRPFSPAGPFPAARSDHMQIVDPVTERLIVFGGRTASLLFGDAWQLNLAGSPAWSPVAAVGDSIPAARQAGTALYDPIGRRMVVFGGLLTGNVATNDIYLLSLDGTPTWTKAAPGLPAPSPRADHSAVYDPTRGRMLVFGGSADLSHGDNDVWALDLATLTWTQVVAPGGPSGRFAHLSVYDTARDRMLVFGGFDAATSYRNDVWELSFATPTPTWTQLGPAGAAPTNRDLESGLYDPTFDRMILFGGSGPLPPLPVAVALGDVFALQFADLPTPTLAALIDATAGPGAASLTWFTSEGAGVPAQVERTVDGATWTVRARIVSDASGRLAYTDALAEGGRYGYRLAIGPTQDRTAVTWLNVPAAGPAAEIGLSGAWPNPSRGAPTLSFTLAAGAGPARLDVFDVAGRHVYSRDVAALGPGAHTLDLKGAMNAHTGVYLVTLRQGQATTTRKFTVLP